MLDFFRYPRDAAGWVVRLSTADVGHREWSAFVRWLSHRQENASAFCTHASLWQSAAGLEPGPALARAIRFSQEAAPARRKWRPALIAATLAAATVIAGPLLAPRDGIESGVRETRRISLSDGSVLWLNTDTRIEVDFSDSRRRIILDRGEAFFEVAHDALRPFDVIAGSHRVTAIGTKFSVIVDSASADFDVAVAEGIVEVRELGTVGKPAPQRLPAGARLVRTHDHSASAVRRINVEQVASWRTGRLVFDEVPVERVLKEVNRYSARKLIIEDPTIRALRLGGTFSLDDVDSVAAALRDIYGLRILPTANGLEVAR